MSAPAGAPVRTWRTATFARLAERLDGVLGARTATPFEALRVITVGDLLHLLPRRYFAADELSDLSVLQPDTDVAVVAVVERTRLHPPPPGRAHGRGAPRGRLEAQVTDRRGRLTLTFFGNAGLLSYWDAQLVPGARGIFAGRVKEFNHQLQLAHPDFVLVDADGRFVGGQQRNAAMAGTVGRPLVGLYPQSAKLRTWTVAECVGLVLDGLELDDPLPEPVRREAEVIGLAEAFRAVHHPASRAEVEAGHERLRFDEAFGLQLAMARRRADAAAHGALARPRRAGGLLDAFDADLPFTLTEGQRTVAAEIEADLARTRPMQRLLQGEVGSGKTLVALRGMLTVVDAGGQAALLAPTEVLAVQHHRTLLRLLGERAVGGLFGGSGPSTTVTLLTGSMTAAQKRAATLQIASGEAGLVVGTHALLGTGVQFADLGLVVVDEQHRFGVEQRAALSAKAVARPHVLVMTATPIPRSVAMTVFGDLEVSTLREVPTGRAEVATVVVDAVRRPGWVERAWGRVVEEVAAGRQAYVVCARISSGDPAETPEASTADGAAPLPPAAAVEDRFAELVAGPLAALRVEMLHGRLPSEDKDAVMRRFAAGETDVLVATTVIEVGVDVPNASVMVVCDADRFGISQLHQLRGRIGRGGHPGVCLLLTAAPEGSPARERLDAVAASRDGFVLAEVDLQQRREGDVLGASQSGHRSSLRLLRVLEDADVIAVARDLAEQALREDPELEHPGLADLVDQVERQAAGEWLERS